MTFLWDSIDSQEEEASPPARAEPGTPVWSRRGLLHIAISCAGWLLLIPLVLRAQNPSLGGFYGGVSILLAASLLASLVSITAILTACVRRSWGVALVSLVLAATAVVVATRQNSDGDYIDHRYRAHRTALAELAREYRAGRLDGKLVLPPSLRSLSPSGIAYAGPTALFVQLWQNWRAESGTGLAYFAEPPTAQTTVTTASGDFGYPRREVGDGWWWVA
ncbi:hypothetical protein AB0G04_35940 [Actinoplanes sp. NPDC023801]|uniref:hypothetical protein n=1 Tax=Actinoplanes sp. NPDC023801 TaxID=3154595 RepID=UPI0033C24574